MSCDRAPTGRLCTVICEDRRTEIATEIAANCCTGTSNILDVSLLADPAAVPTATSSAGGTDCGRRQSRRAATSRKRATVAYASAPIRRGLPLDGLPANVRELSAGPYYCPRSFCDDAPRSRPGGLLRLRFDAHVLKYAPLRCWSFDHSSASSPRPRRRAELAGRGIQKSGTVVLWTATWRPADCNVAAYGLQRGDQGAATLHSRHRSVQGIQTASSCQPTQRTLAAV